MEHNIAIYCRVSTQMQSTDRQREELLALAKNKGWEITEDRILLMLSVDSKQEKFALNSLVC